MTDFRRDRVGTNGHPEARPSRMTYMAHGKGYVMVRHPGCTPFAISEAAWLAFPIFQIQPKFRPAGSADEFGVERAEE